MADDAEFSALRKGLLEFAVLAVISGARVYVADLMGRLSSTHFATQEGTLYPLLSKLRREELVDYEWVESDAGPPRKYYSLTERGEARLASLKAYWRDLNTALESLGR